MATKKQSEQVEQVDSVAVFVQVDATVGAVKCSAGDVLEGVPAEVVQALSGVVDSAAAAVEYARSAGAAVKQYAAEESSPEQA